MFSKLVYKVFSNQIAKCHQFSNIQIFKISDHIAFTRNSKNYKQNKDHTKLSKLKNKPKCQSTQHTEWLNLQYFPIQYLYRRLDCTGNDNIHYYQCIQLSYTSIDMPQISVFWHSLQHNQFFPNIQKRYTSMTTSGIYLILNSHRYVYFL